MDFLSIRQTPEFRGVLVMLAWAKDALPIGSVVKIVGHPSRAPGMHGITGATFTKTDETPIGPGGARGEYTPDSARSGARLERPTYCGPSVFKLKENWDAVPGRCADAITVRQRSLRPMRS